MVLDHFANLAVSHLSGNNIPSSLGSKVGRPYYFRLLQNVQVTIACVVTRGAPGRETGKISLDELVPRIRELQSRHEQLQARRIEVENQMSDRKVELTDL